MISHVQHGSFGGPGLDSDEYYSAGSDDFCAYVWKVPGVEELRLARETVSANRWKSLGEERIGMNNSPNLLFGGIAYVHLMNSFHRLPDEGQAYTSRPLDPARAACRFVFSSHIPVVLLIRTTCTGHKSIVNTALFHPHLPLLLTAGVERHIFIHSPTPNGPCLDEMEPTPTEVRQLPGLSLDSHRIMIRALTSGLAMDDDDASTIALFDE